MAFTETHPTQNRTQNGNINVETMPGSKSGAELVSYFDGLFTQARDNRQQFERQWFTNMAFYFGRHYVKWVGGTADLSSFSRMHEPKAPPWRVRLVINKSRVIIRKEIAKITKEKPRGFVIPASTDDEDLAAARAGDAIYEHLWRELNLSTVERRTIFWTSLTGTAYIKDWYDPKKPDGSNQEGSIQAEHVSPFHLYVPELQEEEIENQPWVIHTLVKDVSWVEEAYGKRVSSESSGKDDTIEAQLSNALGTNEGKSSKSGKVAVKEAWVKPCKKFPKGCLFVWAGTTVLSKSDEWPWAHGQFPFSKITHIPTGRFYGDSVLVDIIPLQRELNRTRSQLVEAKNRMAKPQLVAPRGSIDPNRLTSEPGQVILYTPGFTPPQPLQLSPIPSYVTDEIERIERDLSEISSQHEISSGRTPPGVSAATAIGLLLESDDTVLAGTIASLEEAVEKLGRHMLSHVGQFWAAERTIKIVGGNSQYETQMFNQASLNGNTDFRVEAGSATPRSRAAKQAFIMELMEKGYIPPDKGLKYLDMAETGKMYEESQGSTRQAQRENLLLLQGQEVPVHSYDDDIAHIEEHWNKMRTQEVENAEDEVRLGFEAHVEGHKAKMASEMGIPYIPGSPQMTGIVKNMLSDGQYLAFVPPPIPVEEGGSGAVESG